MLLNRDKSYLTDSSASPITVMITSFLRGGIVVCNRILIVHANGQPNPTSRCDLFFTNKKVNHTLLSSRRNIDDYAELVEYRMLDRELAVPSDNDHRTKMAFAPG